MRIVVDTREQRPYKFSHSTRACLSVGDYSVEGYEKYIALERKSHSDLMSCLGRNKQHLESQLKKLSKIKHRIVLLDTSPEAILLGSFYSQIPGEIALQKILAYGSRFHIDILFAGTKGNKVAGIWLANAFKMLNGIQIKTNVLPMPIKAAV